MQQGGRIDQQAHRDFHWRERVVPSRHAGIYMAGYKYRWVGPNGLPGRSGMEMGRSQSSTLLVENGPTWICVTWWWYTLGNPQGFQEWEVV